MLSQQKKLTVNIYRKCGANRREIQVGGGERRREGGGGEREGGGRGRRDGGRGGAVEKKVKCTFENLMACLKQVMNLSTPSSSSAWAREGHFRQRRRVRS